MKDFKSALLEMVKYQNTKISTGLRGPYPQTFTPLLGLLPGA